MDTRKQIETGYRLKSNKQSELKRIEQLLCRANCNKTRACIEHRSLIQIAKIREHFDRISKESGNQAVGNSLPVVCVSAAKYLDLLDGKPPSPGFPLPKFTRIPELRKILASTTLKARHRNAKAALEEIEALVVSIKSWAKTLGSAYQLSPELRVEIEEKFEEDADNMLEVLVILRLGSTIFRLDISSDVSAQSFSQLHLKATADIVKAIRTGILSKVRPVEISAASKAPDTADDWARPPVHWSTYRAIINAWGEFQSSVRVAPYSWSDNL